MKSIYIFIATVIIAAGAYLAYALTNQNPASPSPSVSASQSASMSPSFSPYLSASPSISQSPSVSPTGSPTAEAEAEIEIEDSSFRPSIITIKAGTTVTWKNRDSISHKVASNPHPLHTDLPGLVSPILAKDQRYSFKFTQTGTFGYHDHLNPLIDGIIIVIP